MIQVSIPEYCLKVIFPQFPVIVLIDSSSPCLHCWIFVQFMVFGESSRIGSSNSWANSLHSVETSGLCDSKSLRDVSFSSAGQWKVKGKSFSHVRLLVTPWAAAYQAPLSMGFSRQEYWSRVPLPSLKRHFYLAFSIHSLALLSETNSCISWSENPVS